MGFHRSLLPACAGWGQSTWQGDVSCPCLSITSRISSSLSSALRSVSSAGAFAACPDHVGAHLAPQARAPSVHRNSSTQTSPVTPWSLSSCAGMKTTRHRLRSCLSLSYTHLICTFSVLGRTRHLLLPAECCPTRTLHPTACSQRPTFQDDFVRGRWEGGEEIRHIMSDKKSI